MEPARRERVCDVMERNVSTVDANACLREAIELMRHREQQLLLVVREGRLAGVLTDRDALAWAPAPGTGTHTLESRVHVVMERKPLSVGPDEPLDAALALMLHNGVHALPVVSEEGGPLGVLRLNDVAQNVRPGAAQGTAPAVET